MYTRITTGRYDAARSEEIHQFITNTILAAARSLPGFGSYKGGLDRARNRMVAITTWDTEEQARSFRDQLGSDILRQIQDLGIQLDEAQTYETVVDA